MFPKYLSISWGLELNTLVGKGGRSIEWGKASDLGDDLSLLKVKWGGDRLGQGEPS